MARKLDRKAMAEKLSAYIKENYGTQATAAKCWGITRAAVSLYALNKQQIPPFILEEMGYKKEILYVRAG